MRVATKSSDLGKDTEQRCGHGCQVVSISDRETKSGCPVISQSSPPFALDIWLQDILSANLINGITFFPPEQRVHSVTGSRVQVQGGPCRGLRSSLPGG